ncbi:MAG: hypothetical protein JOZ80_04435 [Acidobacteriaceae bacterium]|nr:hypothetical protein [Acidobacteriaceae bacterium]
MKKSGKLIPASFLVVLLLMLGSFAGAQDQPVNPPTPDAQGEPAPPAGAQDPSANTADPPGRVARVDYMTGQVSVQPHGTDDWVQAEANRPLTIADNVWADKDSRAELDFGTGVMRINSETSLTLTNVDNNIVQVSLHQGALNVSLRKLYSGETWEIDTPNMAFTVSKPGDYRFDADPNDDTTLVTVWKGDGEATGQGQAVQVRAGEQIRFSNGTSLTHEAKNAPQPDGFDEWCQVRDRQHERSVSARHVAPGTVGTDDLDQYGTWKDTPDYGPVWVPTSVAPDWAPYTYGHWIWEEPWGWTWVDAYPWGFAPFHYGRWVSWGGYWGWAPGPYWVRPWYAPALVAWFGGPGWGIGFGWGWGFGVGFHGGFGWCPLGFGEPFFPWYHGGRGYFRNVNISNTRITNINNVTNNYFRNGATSSLYGRNGVAMPRFANKPGAVTAMSRNGLERGLPVRGNSVHPTANQLRGASALGRVEANPTRQAMLGGRTGETAARPSAGAFSHATFSRMTPPAASRTAMTRAGESSFGRNVGTSVARSNASPAEHTNAGIGAARTPTAGARYVPRPPQSIGANSPSRIANGSSNVPRPSSSVGARGENTQIAMNHNVPRPPSSGLNSRTPSETTARSTMSTRSVPRPSGPVQRTYSGSGYGGNYSNRSYGGGNASRSYGGYSTRAYGGNSAYGGYSGRNYGGYGSSGGSHYGAPSYGSYGGHGGYSAPHSSGGGSHGGGGGGGFHGGGGSHGGGGGGSHGGGGHR